MLLKQYATRKEKWKFFLVEIVALLLLPKRPFRQVYHESTSDRVVVWCPRVDRGWFCYWKNLTIETEILLNIVESKTTNGTMVSQVSKVLHLCPEKSTSVSRKIPEFIPEEFLTFFHSLLKNLFTGKFPNLHLPGRLAHVSKNWKKLTQDHEIVSTLKWVRDTILESSGAKDYSKTGDNFQNTGIVNISGDYGNAGQRIHKKVEYQFSYQFLSNVLLVKKKGRGNCPCIKLKALNKFIPYKHLKMDSLHRLKYLLEDKNFLGKLYLKDAYFSVQLCIRWRVFVRFGRKILTTFSAFVLD